MNYIRKVFFIIVICLGAGMTAIHAQNENNSLSTCLRTGCSGQICSDQEVITTCEWNDSYACYQNATCERQLDGNCGWTQTSELSACLSSNPPSQPLLCTSAACTVSITGQGKSISCHMDPVASEIVADRSISYSGYCLRTRPDVEQANRPQEERIELEPTVKASSSFQPVQGLPGTYTCYFRYCLTDSSGTFQCLPWGQGGISPTPSSSSFICPQTEWINCMPGPGTPNPMCSTEYLNWAKNNCDGFQGAAY